MKKKLVMVTAWDFPTGQVLDSAGIDYILVGDSLAMSILGHPSTQKIGMEEMLHHTKAVALGALKTPIIADMPIDTYKTPQMALQNARKLIQAGGQFVKFEGADVKIVKVLVANNIPVVGHLGLTPQTATAFKVRGREEKEAEQIFADAIALANAGISLLILECVPYLLAKKITETIPVPTIGIGAGKYTSGQVLVFADILGLSGKNFKMAKQYVDLRGIMSKAVNRFKNDVEKGRFPKKENSFT